MDQPPNTAAPACGLSEFNAGLEQPFRFFLVGYSFSSETRTGNGNLWFGLQKFPANDWLKRRAAEGQEGFSEKNVVVMHITELSEDDFNSFIATSNA